MIPDNIPIDILSQNLLDQSVSPLILLPNSFSFPRIFIQNILQMDFIIFVAKEIHQATNEEDITKYPKKVSGLCKYRTGQCDYYNVCMSKINTSK